MRGKDKQAGVLLPLFSLPSAYGIGDLGAEAYRFIDLLSECGQNYWQLLPGGVTSYGDSPYQSPSVFAGNPYFISPDKLHKQGLLTDAELDGQVVPIGPIDYARMYNTRYTVLRAAFSRWQEDDGYAAFCEKNARFLLRYCLFSAMKNREGGKCFLEWEHEPKTYARALEGFRKLTGVDYDESVLSSGTKYSVLEGAEVFAAVINDVRFNAFLQYQFYTQWGQMREYACQKGIRLIGDVPIYVAMDSCDVWAQPELFQLDEDMNPTAVAGVPPDSFCADGQLWGNPLYNWDNVQRGGFEFWIDRIDIARQLYDVVRIDHFRGFAAYFAIPYGKKAQQGSWRSAPGKELFAVLKQRFGDYPIIAEDLGLLDDEVRELLGFTGYPGMKVLQFAFDNDNSEYLPRNFTPNCVCYTGTHDNMTSKQWIGSLSSDAKKRLRAELKRKPFETAVCALIRLALGSPAETVIIPAWDYLQQGKEGRVNTPSTVGDNWKYRLPEGYASAMRKAMSRF